MVCTLGDIRRDSKIQMISDDIEDGSDNNVTYDTVMKVMGSQTLGRLSTTRHVNARDPRPQSVYQSVSRYAL